MNVLYSVVLALLVLFNLATAQKQIPHKTEILEGSDAEVLGKIQGQLLNALELLQTYQEEPVVGIPPNQLKFTEKRRNKFEFIRFGRR